MDPQGSEPGSKSQGRLPAGVTGDTVVPRTQTKARENAASRWVSGGEGGAESD